MVPSWVLCAGPTYFCSTKKIKCASVAVFFSSSHILGTGPGLSNTYASREREGGRDFVTAAQRYLPAYLSHCIASRLAAHDWLTTATFTATFLSSSLSSATPTMHQEENVVHLAQSLGQGYNVPCHHHELLITIPTQHPRIGHISL